MPNAHASLSLTIAAAVALVACTTRQRATPEPHVAVPSPSCTADTTPVTVAITTEVDPRSARDFLATAPLGPCTTLVPRRIPVDGARDALDSGVAMLITSSPTALTYAGTRTDLQSTPLPWDRTYVLMVADSARPPLPSSGSALDALRAELARDVVLGDARAATMAACGTSTRSAPGRLTTIRYRVSDTTARSIAARLAAVGGDSVRIDGYEHEGLGTAEAAFVTSFAGWDTGMCDLTSWIIPLVETRARAITPAASLARP